jgi:hypothetical protein
MSWTEVELKRLFTALQRQARNNGSQFTVVSVATQRSCWGDLKRCNHRTLQKRM